MSEPIEEPQADEPGEAEESQFQRPENPQEPEPEEADAEPEEPVADLSDIEPPEEQPQGMSEKELERSLKALERGSTGWRNKVDSIMGAEAAMLLPCPLCEPIIPGFVMQLDESRKTAVRAFIGDRPLAEYRPDTHSQRCEACNGLGEVETGSLVPAKAVVVCMDCNGNGAVGERFEGRALVSNALVPPTQPNGPPAQGFSPEDLAEAQRLREKGMVVITPAPPPL